MKLKVKRINIQAGKPIAFVHKKDASTLHLNYGDRIEIISPKKKLIAIVDLIDRGMLSPGTIGLSDELIENFNFSSGGFVEIQPILTSKSSKIIQLRAKCKPYTKEELVKIMKDIVSNSLSEVEIAYFISGLNYCGMTLEETKYLTEAVFETGRKLDWGTKAVADKHSIGGIPGNRTTPIVVSICASAGILFPKTSSRAITSASGTADTMEAITKVDLSISKMKSVVAKTGACLAWGGSLGLAPADDKLIRVEKILNLDPEPQLLASILAKKLAAGSKYVLIDIPYGDGAKVTRKKAISLKNKFIKLGKMLGLKINVALTDGSQPIGNGVGPFLEIQDILNVLRRENSPKDLEKKSIFLAGKILELMKKAKKGQGQKKAKEILESGKAFEKFKQIVETQGGSLDNIKQAIFSHDVKSIHNGKVVEIENRSINYVARLAGSPNDKTAGIYLHKHVGEKIQKGDKIVTIYSGSNDKLIEALNFFNDFKPVKIK